MNKLERKNVLLACQSDLSRHAGIDMTLKQVEELMTEKKNISSENLRWLWKDCEGSDMSVPRDGLDTLPRDYLFDWVARVFVGRAYWPLNGDGPSQDFFTKLAKALTKKGIKHRLLV